jgi:hypothetical protein
VTRSPLPWHVYRRVSTSSEEGQGPTSTTLQGRYRDSSRDRRRFFGGVGVTILALSVFGLLFSRPTNSLERAKDAAAPGSTGPAPAAGSYEAELTPVSSVPLSPQQELDPFDSSNYLVGPPSASFRGTDSCPSREVPGYTPIQMLSTPTTNISHLGYLQDGVSEPSPLFRMASMLILSHRSKRRYDICTFHSHPQSPTTKPHYRLI